MNKNKLHRIGTISVDAGIVGVGDPCYVLHREENDKYKEFGKDWREFVDIFYRNEDDRPGNYVDFNGLMTVVNTPYGDGHYGVWAEFGRDGISKLVIDLDQSFD